MWCLHGHSVQTPDSNSQSGWRAVTHKVRHVMVAFVFLLLINILHSHIRASRMIPSKSGCCQVHVVYSQNWLVCLYSLYSYTQFTTDFFGFFLPGLLMFWWASLPKWTWNNWFLSPTSREIKLLGKKTNYLPIMEADAPGKNSCNSICQFVWSAGSVF